MKVSKAILFATSGFLVLIWMSAFLISYTTLVSVAVSGGLGYPWAYIWPLCLDAFMTIASLDVIRRELNGEPTLPAWFVVVVITIASTAFNVTQAQTTALSWSVHALSPVVCCVSFEIFMGVLRSHFRQRDDTPTPKPTPKPVTTTKATKTPRAKRQETTPEVRNTITEYYHEHPGVGYAEAARDIGISRHVVRATVLKIEQSQSATGEI